MNVLIARFVRGGWEHYGLGSWLAACVAHALTGPVPRIELNHCVQDQCPTDAARNAVMAKAMTASVDALFMVDHDNVPHPEWFAFALRFLAKRPAAVLAAPYCGAAPTRAVQVTMKMPHTGKVVRLSRAAAARRGGLEPAYGVGTVLAVGTRCLDLIQPPYFAYRYDDAEHTSAGTEDFTFSERLVDAGGEVLVSFDHWARHWKPEMVGKPEPGDGPEAAECQGEEFDR